MGQETGCIFHRGKYTCSSHCLSLQASFQDFQGVCELGSVWETGNSQLATAVELPVSDVLKVFPCSATCLTWYSERLLALVGLWSVRFKFSQKMFLLSPTSALFFALPYCQCGWGLFCIVWNGSILGRTGLLYCVLRLCAQHPCIFEKKERGRRGGTSWSTVSVWS